MHNLRRLAAMLRIGEVRQNDTGGHGWSRLPGIVGSELSVLDLGITDLPKIRANIGACTLKFLVISDA